MTEFAPRGIQRWDSDGWKNGAPLKTKDWRSPAASTEQPDWLSSSSEGLDDSESDDSGAHVLAPVAEESKAAATIAEQISALQGKVQLAIDALGPAEPQPGAATTMPASPHALLGPSTPVSLFIAWKCLLGCLAKANGWVRSAELSPQLWRLRQLEHENRVLRQALQERDLEEHQRDTSRLQAQLGCAQVHGLAALSVDDIADLTDLVSAGLRRLSCLVELRRLAQPTTARSEDGPCSVGGRAAPSGGAHLKELRARLDRLRQQG
ncbi:hypothetical protein N2152v2_008196 [Parachlorella kessleri]